LEPKILVIDNESDIAYILRRWLLDNGIFAAAFTQPKEAFMHWKEHSTEYCLVLSDIRMPGLTGFEIARSIRKINPDVKIILFSAFEINMQEFEKVMPNTRVDEFIEKPINRDKLLQVIRKHIGNSKNLPTSRSPNAQVNQMEENANAKT
jgi:DNA-binding NtrC family response regulator